MTFYERIQQIKTKSRLKAAFRRKPKPARVKLEDEFNDVKPVTMNLKDPNLTYKLERFSDHKQWTVGRTNDGRIYIQDDNFEYDARLYINGDFLDIELQERYARAIAKVLNEHTNNN